MSEQHISSFLGRARKIANDSENILKSIQESIYTHTKQHIPTELISIRKNILTISIKPFIKQEIILFQKKILADIKEGTGQAFKRIL